MYDAILYRSTAVATLPPCSLIDDDTNCARLLNCSEETWATVQTARHNYGRLKKLDKGLMFKCVRNSMSTRRHAQSTTKMDFCENWVCRSWEKLHEIVSRYQLWDESTNIVVDLAAGPGSWSQYVSRVFVDKLPTVRLQLVSFALPGSMRWSSSVAPQQQQHTIVHGNLFGYDVAIERLRGALGGRCADVVIADGASHSTNTTTYDVEECNEFLVCSEIKIALSLLRVGGSFLLKTFDLTRWSTLESLWTVCNMFETTRVLKPVSSVGVNSEKYLLFTGFFGSDKTVQANGSAFLRFALNLYTINEALLNTQITYLHLSTSHFIEQKNK